MLGMFLGAILLLAGLFFVYLLKVMKEVRDTVGAFAKVLDPLIKSGSLQRLTDSTATLAGIGVQALQAMKAINVTVAAFNKAFFKADALEELERSTPEELAEKETAQPGDSAVFHHSDEEAAGRETAEELRRGGVEVDESRIMVPEKQHGSTV